MSIGEFNLTTNEYTVCAKMNSLMIKSEFVIWLQSEMEKRGWNHTDLANEAGLSRRAVGNVLRQEREPGKVFLISIARALRLPPETVFRMAGLLPEAPEETEEADELLHLAAQLPEELRKQLLEYARFLLSQAEAESRKRKR